VTLFIFLSLKKDVNVASKSNKQKKLCKKIVFYWHLEVQWENSRIRIRFRIHWSEAWIPGSGSTPKCHGSATLISGISFDLFCPRFRHICIIQFPLVGGKIQCYFVTECRRITVWSVPYYLFIYPGSLKNGHAFVENSQHHRSYYVQYYSYTYALNAHILLFIPASILDLFYAFHDALSIY
jgi:hypothetical protein